MATSPSTPSPMPCWAPPGSATSGGSSRPMPAPRAASPAAILLGEVRRRVEGAGWRPSAVDLTIIAARPRLDTHLDAMRVAIAGLLGLDPRGGQRQGVDRQPRRRRGRRPVDLRPGRRHGRGRPMTIRLHDTLSGETRPLVPLRRRPGRDLFVRADGLRPGAHRQFPVVPVRRPPRPPPALARPRRDLGHEHHRRRRQDHPGRRGGRRGDRRGCRALHRSRSSPTRWRCG